MKFKNYLRYAAALLALVMVSCDPLEDVFTELDEAASDKIVADLNITLTDDDYEVADDACSCARFGNFSSLDDVKAGVPAVLNNNYPHLGDGSSAIVNYEFYNGSSPDLRRDQFIFTVTEAEYDALGFGFGNFSNLSRDIPIYAAFKEEGRDGQYMDITHDFWTGSTVVEMTSRAVYTVAYGWQWTFILPDDAYGDFFNESGIDFSSSSEGREKMPVYLNEFMSRFVDEGSVLVAQYNHDDNNEGPTPDVGLYIFSGGEWLLYNDHFQISNESLSFGHDGTTWVPDNTIKYTVTAADYTAIAAQYAGTPNGDNLARFGNFNRQGGGTHWSDEAIIEALGWLLENGNFVNEEGQKYLITTAGYNGANITEVWSLIRTSGAWVLNN